MVAAEPHVADPVAMDFDARGRIFVCEIHGYNLEGYLDIQELNKTGVLDTAVRRIPANPDAIKRAEQEQYGTVKLLEDTDGDGRVDRSHVWADRLPACYGVVAARDGVIALCAPDILFLADRDGDGRAEVRETLFSGFGLYDMWSRISNPRRGVDNWIYAANGINSGGTIRGPHLAGEVKIPATSFRFKADGSALEPTSGSASGFGLAIDDWGDRFLVTNQQHALLVAPLAYHYLARNPYYAAPNPVLNISTLRSSGASLSDQPAGPVAIGTQQGPGLGQVLRRGRNDGQWFLYGRQRTSDLPGRRVSARVLGQSLQRRQRSEHGPSLRAGAAGRDLPSAAPAGRRNDGVPHFDRTMVSAREPDDGSGRRAVRGGHVPGDHRRLLGHPAVPAAAVHPVPDRRQRSGPDLEDRRRRSARVPR